MTRGAGAAGKCRTQERGGPRAARGPAGERSDGVLTVCVSYPCESPLTLRETEPHVCVSPSARVPLPERNARSTNSLSVRKRGAGLGQREDLWEREVTVF
ncbi:hypothetical protein NDU88_009531 [Pleurodeles waltl]|uniref:Uncharacterized protein n=1 Tax=Pleurodeles waltl TaxID=8319 RepID=A0AAV7NZK9_PLEWA|nr:hypothetical protein NDU88_009531 [Pleurodeles waltl]